MILDQRDFAGARFEQARSAQLWWLANARGTIDAVAKRAPKGPSTAIVRHDRDLTGGDLVATRAPRDQWCAGRQAQDRGPPSYER